MPLRPCPICRHSTPRWLETCSQDAYVNYYRCEPCGHVWTVPKNDPNGLVTPVTTKADRVLPAAIPTIRKTDTRFTEHDGVRADEFE